MLGIFLQQEPRPWRLTTRDAAYLVEPPDGVSRAFGSDRPTLAPGLVAFGCASTALAAIAIMLRLYTRTYIVRNTVSVDDCEYIGLVFMESY